MIRSASLINVLKIYGGKGLQVAGYNDLKG